MEALKTEAISHISELDKAVAWIVSTLANEESENIFINYYEIRANLQSNKVNLPLCLNRMSLVLKDLEKIKIEPELMAYFYSFNRFIKQELSKNWIEIITEKVQKIIYLEK